MRVYVDPPGRHHQPRGIDLAPRGPLLAADSRDPAIRNGNIAAECGLAGAIDDRASANDDIVHANLPCGVAPPRPPLCSTLPQTPDHENSGGCSAALTYPSFRRQECAGRSLPATARTLPGEARQIANPDNRLTAMPMAKATV